MRKNKILLDAIQTLGTYQYTADLIGVGVSTLFYCVNYERRLPILSVLQLCIEIDFKYMPWEIDPKRDWTSLIKYSDHLYKKFPGSGN